MLARLKLMWADGGYKEGVGEWVKQTVGWTLQMVQHPWAGIKGVWAPKDAVIDWDKIKPKGFHTLPRRWVVERTFWWLGQSRRLAKDYEYLPATSEVVIYTSMIRLMLTRLARE